MDTILRFIGYPNNGHCFSECQLEVNHPIAEVSFFQKPKPFPECTEDKDYLLTRRGDDHGTPVSSVQYRKLVKHWVKMIGLLPEGYSTHSLGRTLPSWIYKKTTNTEAVPDLLGQSSVTATSRYLNVGGKESLDIAREFRLSS